MNPCLLDNNKMLNKGIGVTVGRTNQGEDASLWFSN